MEQKRMDSRKKRMFSCTWGKAASLKRKSCAVKGLETKLWHKLCRENTRGQKPPKIPKPQNSSTSCICQEENICQPVYLRFFRVGLPKEGGRCLFPCVCLSEIQALVPGAARRENSRELWAWELGHSRDGPEAAPQLSETLQRHWEQGLLPSNTVKDWLGLRTPLQRPFV